MVKNKQCLCCGTKYSYCPDCSKSDALAPAWRAEFCSEDCMTIWTTATRFNLGKLTKSEAKSIISALTLKPAEQYSKCIQRDLGVILAAEPKPRRSKKIELPVAEEIIPVVETAPEVIVEEAPAVPTDIYTHEVVNKTEE